MWDAGPRIAGRVGEYLKEGASVAAIKFAMVPPRVKPGSCFLPTGRLGRSKKGFG
jgi:hypothetical protein